MAPAQSPTVQQEAVQLKKNLLEHHVSPRPINDAFSIDVFENFLTLADADKLYFTQHDIDQMSVYQRKLDEELNGGPWNFLPKATVLFREALRRAEAAIVENTAKTFDYSSHEIYYRPSNWASNDDEINDRWRLHLKLKTLGQLPNTKTGTLPAVETAKEGSARNAVSKSSIRAIKRILNHPVGFENYTASLFLRAIGLAFDPHTTHFSFSEIQDYLASVSTEGYYFGITIDESDKGEIVVSELIPGGPAWKSGMVHSGDVIERVRWGTSAWIDLDGMTREEMNDLLSESNQAVMEFTLKKAGGIRQNVWLKKEKMQSDENVVRSFILDGNQRIGYIALPGFYSAWDGSAGARCANDLAKEILKLKKEDIDGLILDVRYNRGGSLQEAVAIAGIFLDAGPMGLLKDKSGTITSLKDMNRGTIYDGPLMVMVNRFSASASEFLAAALQDYNRAIIVGSRTYGKATGQRIYSMESEKGKNAGWGFSTITSIKIYRVTGKTAQGHGVNPDITLPDLYDNLEFGESFITGALPADSVTKKTYFMPLNSIDVAGLQLKSEKRVSSSQVFSLTADASRQLRNLSDSMDSVSLKWSDYSALVAKESQLFKDLELARSKPTEAFKISAPAFNQQRLQIDDYVRQQHEGWIKNLTSDIAVEESYNIISDYIAARSAN